MTCGRCRHECSECLWGGQYVHDCVWHASKDCSLWRVLLQFRWPPAILQVRVKQSCQSAYTPSQLLRSIIPVIEFHKVSQLSRNVKFHKVLKVCCKGRYLTSAYVAYGIHRLGPIPYCAARCTIWPDVVMMLGYKPAVPAYGVHCLGPIPYCVARRTIWPDVVMMLGYKPAVPAYGVHRLGPIPSK